MTNLGRRIAVTGSAAALLLAALATPAAAHVTADPDEAGSSHFTTWLRIGHGCDGAPTTEVRIQIPDGVQGARGEVVPGWEMETTEEDGRVTEVSWVGGSLPDSQFQRFGVSFQITEDASDVLWLPTVQECDEGANRWIEIPDSLDGWGDLDSPAPYVVNATDGGGHGHGDEEEAAAEGDAEEGDADAGDAGENGDSADAAGDAETEETAATDGGTDAVAVTALVLAIVGLLAAGAALVLGRRRGSGASA